MSTEATDTRDRLGRVLLVVGAIPAALFGVGLTLCGLCMIPLSVSDPNTIDLGAAFAAIFAVLTLPAGILSLLTLVLSRLSNRLLAAVGAVGNLFFGWLGVVLLFTASPSGRASSGGAVGILSASFLFAGYSSLLGHWLRRRLPPGWIIGSAAFGLMMLSALTLREWSLRSRMQVLEGHTDQVRAVAWSPDGTKLVSGSDDLTLIIWDTETGKPLRTLRANANGGWTIWCVAWSPDGATIASCSDTMVFLWDAETGVLQSTLKGHDSMVVNLTWSPIDARLASASRDKKVVVWNVETGERLHILDTDWGGRGLQAIRDFSGGMGIVALSPDGAKLAATSAGDEVIVIDLETGDKLHTLAGHKSSVRSLAWSPDGERLASGSSDQAVFLWDAETGQRLRALRGHTHVVWDVAWSPDGTRLASGSLDNTIVLWDVAP